MYKFPDAGPCFSIDLSALMPTTTPLTQDRITVYLPLCGTWQGCSTPRVTSDRHWALLYFLEEANVLMLVVLPSVVIVPSDAIFANNQYPQGTLSDGMKCAAVLIAHSMTKPWWAYLDAHCTAKEHPTPFCSVAHPPLMAYNARHILLKLELLSQTTT